MITADIILDSISPANKRLTTWVLTYPRFVHAEVMTHRVFSRNASSSRAIPITKLLEAVKTNPAMPVWWGKNQSGMQANEQLDDTKQDFFRSYEIKNEDGLITAKMSGMSALKAAKLDWLDARDQAVVSVRKLMEVGLHKQIANRVIEPWTHITVILSGTEFENFFSLRAHKDAQPEFQELANIMLEKYNVSTPQNVDYDKWHIPFGDKLDDNRIMATEAWKKETDGMAFGLSGDIQNYLNDFRLKIATARCARVSYLNFEGKDDYESDIALADRLASSGHWSPFEHCATPLTSDHLSSGMVSPSNFVGWVQYRKHFSDTENRTDSRVIKKFYQTS